MDKFEQHIAKEATLKLKRDNGEEDAFTFQPLPFKYMPKIFNLMKNMSKLKKFQDADLDKLSDEDTEMFFSAFDEKTMESMRELIMVMMKHSYPNEKDDKLEKFAAANMMKLFPILFELNSYNR